MTENYVKSISRQLLGQLCHANGPALELAESVDTSNGKPIDGVRLLWALCGVESSFGANMAPRHEPSWDKGGALYTASTDLQEYIAKYPYDGACSYGPLQVMAYNLQPYTPEQLAADPALTFAASIKFFNHYVIEHWKDKTLHDICDTWNGGNPKAKISPAYTTTLLTTTMEGWCLAKQDKPMGCSTQSFSAYVCQYLRNVYIVPSG